MTQTDNVIAKLVLPLVPRAVSPNQITAFRFAITPFVIYLLTVRQYGWGLAVFIIAAFSDAVDGALARKRGPITTWGKVYDPLADKILIASVAALMVSRFLGQWLALLIMAFELCLILGAFWWRKYRGVEIKARAVGKIKMVLQSVGIGLVLLYALWPLAIILAAAEYILYVSIGFAALSLFVYRSI
jgi:CDP-diacylglycerol--glycerol-3-phosphate 3-phosphatidyltransferase